MFAFIHFVNKRKLVYVCVCTYSTAIACPMCVHIGPYASQGVDMIFEVPVYSV